MTFDYQINGRKVSKQRFLRHLEDDAKAKAMPSLAAKVKADVARLRCPAHGEHPKVVKSKINGDRLSVEISACCDQMREKATKVAAGQA